MDVKNNRQKEAAERNTRNLLKGVARRLFAERGIHSVSVREIVQAAKQRNNGVIAYYFGTKDNLIREILIDGAERIEQRRQAFLSDLEARGGPLTVREAVEAIALPTAMFSDEDTEYGSYYTGFLLQVTRTDKNLVGDTLRDQWNTGYQRCLTHLRRLLPHLPASVQNRRFVFMGIMFSALLAQREEMMREVGRSHSMWRSQETLADIVRVVTAMLETPPD